MKFLRKLSLVLVLLFTLVGCDANLYPEMGQNRPNTAPPPSANQLPDSHSQNPPQGASGANKSENQQGDTAQTNWVTREDGVQVYQAPQSVILPDTPSLYLEPTDAWGRPQGGYSILTKSNQRKSAGRPPIKINPPGFHNQQMADGNWLYNRSHLIAYTFYNSPDTETAGNLITGTHYLNQVLMTEWEDRIRGYLNQYPSVRYNVLPVYQKNEIVPSSVKIEIETNDFKEEVILPNIQPGYTIDYTTGYATIDVESEEILEWR